MPCVLNQLSILADGMNDSQCHVSTWNYLVNSSATILSPETVLYWPYGALPYARTDQHSATKISGVLSLQSSFPSGPLAQRILVTSASPNSGLCLLNSAILL